MRAAMDIKASQKVGIIADMAQWFAKAENIPLEIVPYLQLIQFISRDVKYLAELRNEQYSVLQSTPRELNRIDDILTSAAEGLGDIGHLLEKLRAQVDNKGSKSNLPTLWRLPGRETFSIRARSLQIQHQTILSEINHLRNSRLNSPSMQETSKTERHQFENLELLRSLIDGKELSQGTRPKKTAQPPEVAIHQSRIMPYDVMGRPIHPRPCPQSSVVGIDKSMTNVEPILAELPSDDRIHSSHSYNSSSLSLNLHPSVSHLSLHSTSQEQSSTLSMKEPPDCVPYGDVDQRHGASPTAKITTGLMALFQKPVQLGEKPSKPLIPPISNKATLRSQHASLDSLSMPVLSTVSNTGGLIPQRSVTSTQSQSFELDTQSPAGMHGMSHGSRSQTDGSQPSRSSPPRPTQSLPTQTHQADLSRLFVHQPRSAFTSAPQYTTSSVTSTMPPFHELEGSTVTSNQRVQHFFHPTRGLP